jgi:hypothetical protein
VPLAWRISGPHGGEFEDGCLLRCCDEWLVVALMMEAASTSETSVNVYQTTRCSKPEYFHLYSAIISSLSEPEFDVYVENDLRKTSCVLLYRHIAFDPSGRVASGSLVWTLLETWILVLGFIRLRSSELCVYGALILVWSRNWRPRLKCSAAPTTTTYRCSWQRKILP